MSSLVENNILEFRTTFQPVLDQDGFLINQDDLVCREIIRFIFNGYKNIKRS